MIKFRTVIVLPSLPGEEQVIDGEEPERILGGNGIFIII